MPWFKVDDNLGFHHKVIAAGNPALGLWVRAGSVCAQQLTDGFVADHVVAALGTPAQARRLVDVGLWNRTEGGYTFHEWDERQPSRADVEAERAAAKERMRAARERKRMASSGKSSQVSGLRSPEQTEKFGRGSGEVRDVFGDPDPTNKESRARKRATQLPDDFRPSDKHQAQAAEAGIDLRAEWPKFCDHHRAKGSTFKDWNAALNNWIRKASEYAGNVRPLRAEPDDQGRIQLPPLPKGFFDQ